MEGPAGQRLLRLAFWIWVSFAFVLLELNNYRVPISLSVIVKSFVLCEIHRRSLSYSHIYHMDPQSFNVIIHNLQFKWFILSSLKVENTVPEFTVGMDFLNLKEV